MAAYVQDTSFLSRRAIVFVVIVAFHILLIYGLANGLARRVVEVIAPPIQADISEKVEKRDEPPRQPEGNLYQAGRGGQARGDHPGYVMKTSAYTRASLHPLLTGAVLAAGGVALLALLGGSRGSVSRLS